MVKLRTLLTVLLHLILKAEARIMERGVTFPTRSCVFGNHNALGQLANQSRLCLSEGGTL